MSPRAEVVQAIESQSHARRSQEQRIRSKFRKGSWGRSPGSATKWSTPPLQPGFPVCEPQVTAALPGGHECQSALSTGES